MGDLHELIPAAEQRTAAWSGGQTTELAIFPPGASYGRRDFQWRLSTAVVSVPESTFTALPGFQRLLMVLSGQMQLTHLGHHQSFLQPFDQDSFSGSWETICRGTGRDFNLMLASGWQGSLQARTLTSDLPFTIRPEHPAAVSAYYCLAGDAHLQLPSGLELDLGPGDFLQVHSAGVRLHGPATVICACIWRE